MILIVLLLNGFFDEYILNRFFAGFYIYIITTLFYVVIGLILGLDYFITQMKKVGHWKLNVPKLILMGIPSLYFSLTFIVVYHIPIEALSIPMEILASRGNPEFISFFQLILGHTIITSFYKAE